MSETMLALVKTKAEPGLSLETVPVPRTGELDVKIKILKTAICGTDVHIYQWDQWSQEHIKPPMPIGHEFVGRVTEVGRLVNGFAAGDLVSGEGHIVCGTCRNCRAGKRHLCLNTKGVGVDRQGCFAEFLVIPAENVVKIGPGIPLDIAAIFDPLGNAVHTALKSDLVGEDVLITGAGPIGMMAAAVARHSGARHIVLTDLNDYRLDLAKQICPTVRTVNVTRESVRDVMNELGMTEGFDVAMEMSGSKAALDTIWDSMENGGQVSLLGLHGRSSETPWNKIIMKSLNVEGIYGREMFETWYKMMAMIQSGLNLEAIITHRINFRDYEEGFAAMSSGNAAKVVMTWAEDDLA